jgi:hypothetical protein
MICIMANGVAAFASNANLVDVTDGDTYYPTQFYDLCWNW